MMMMMIMMTMVQKWRERSEMSTIRYWILRKNNLIQLFVVFFLLLLQTNTLWGNRVRPWETVRQSHHRREEGTDACNRSVSHLAAPCNLSNERVHVRMGQPGLQVHGFLLTKSQSLFSFPRLSLPLHPVQHAELRLLCVPCGVLLSRFLIFCCLFSFCYVMLCFFKKPNPGSSLLLHQKKLPMACDRPLVTLYGVTSPPVHPPHPLTKPWPLPTRNPATPATPHRTKAEDEGTRGKNTTLYMWKKRNKKWSEMKSLSPSLISLFLSLYFFSVCSV